MKKTAKTSLLWQLAINEKTWTLVFGIAVFLFFGFFYKFHIYFQEQLQLFMLTPQYFFKQVAVPGGFSTYTGGFLTQFYHLPYIGALVISLLLIATVLLSKSILKSLNPNKNLLPLTFLPALIYCTVLCDNYYPVSGLIGFNLALLAIALFIKAKNENVGTAIAIFGVISLYCLAGGSFILFLLSVMILSLADFVKTRKKSLVVAIPILISLIIGILLPLLVKYSFWQVPTSVAYITNCFYDIKGQLPFPLLIIGLILPCLIILFTVVKNTHRNSILMFVNLAVLVIIALLGFRNFMNLNAEEIMAYDYWAKNERWEKMIDHAKKEPPRNNLSLSMLNLALAKTDKMGTDLFRYRQVGPGGLFLEFNRENVSPMMGNEVFYHVGLINASQYYIFESTESTPSLQKSVRAFKRLAETNLINGNYEVARKYVTILKSTQFYRKWASKIEKQLDNPASIKTNPEWVSKRASLLTHDFFINSNEMEKALIYMLNENPSNKMAFEYLMSYYLITKNLNGFMNALPRIRAIAYKEMPQLYQEAALFAISLTTDHPENVTNIPISNKTKQLMRNYADVYTTSPKAEELLKENFSRTFWYYFHYN